MKPSIAILTVAGIGLGLFGLSALQSNAQSCPPGFHMSNAAICVQDCPTDWSEGTDEVCRPDDLQKFLNSVPDPEPAHTRHGPPTLVLPHGKYAITAPLLIDLPVHLVAHGAFIQQTTEGSAVVVVNAPHTIIEGLTVRGKRKHDTQGSRGFVIRAGRTTLRDVWAEDAGIGIEYDGSTANSNGSRIWGAHVWRCSVGVNTFGADANAGTFAALDLKDNLLDIKESSFLGNLWLGPTAHPAGLTPPPHIQVTNNSAAATFVNPYIEGAPNTAGALDMGTGTATVVIGGIAGSTAIGSGSRIAGQRSWIVNDRNDPGLPQGRAEVRMGQNAEFPFRITATLPGEPTVTFGIRHFDTPTPRWCLTSDGTGSGCVLEWE